MSDQRNSATSIDPVKLDRLAEVAVKVGLGLRPGQDLLLTAPAIALPLVRRAPLRTPYRLAPASGR